MKTLQTRLAAMVFLASILFAVRVEAEPQIKPGHTVTNSVGMRLAHIPTGTFTMGSPDSEPGRISNEARSKVTFEKAFYIGVTEVTQKQWRKVMRSDLSFFKGDDLPVEHITWHEAMDFCKRLSEMENKKYRLPTETEWEYACRAGSTTAYHSGDGEDALAEGGWFRKNGGNQTHPVGLKKPNAWGLYDMHGNVSEWCANRAKGDPGTYTAESGFVNQEIVAERDQRGGSWGLNAGDCRSASRHRNDGTFQYFDLGLRVVCEIE